MQELNKWLESEDKDFDQGLVLLNKYCRNRILIQNITRRRLAAKLEYELSKIAKRMAPVQKTSNWPNNGLKNGQGSKPKQDITEKTKEELNKRLKFKTKEADQLPGHLHVLFDDTVLLMNKIKQKHNACKVSTDQGKRAEYIKEIEDLRQQVRANYKILDNWKNKGTEAEETDSPEEETTLTEKEENACRKYISAGKKKLAENKGAARVKVFEAMQKRIDKLVAAGEKFTEDNKNELLELGFKFE